MDLPGNGIFLSEMTDLFFSISSCPSYVHVRTGDDTPVTFYGDSVLLGLFIDNGFCLVVIRDNVSLLGLIWHHVFL